MRYCAGAGDDDANTYNVLDLTLGADVAAPDESVTRAFFTTSSCGLCGKASIDAVRTRSSLRRPRRRTGGDADDASSSLPARLRDAQEIFEQTGGLHAAALFDGATGELLALREDVGRHNAVDKVVGWALREGPASPARVRSCSSRAGHRSSWCRRRVMAGIPMLCAVSAPSSLAVDLAERVGPDARWIPARPLASSSTPIHIASLSSRRRRPSSFPLTPSRLSGAYAARRDE